MNRTEHKMTTAEAVAFVKSAKRGTQFALHIRGEARMADDADDSRIPYGLAGWMNLTKRQAIGIVSEILSPGVESRGGRMPITASVSDYGTTYWIGG